MTPGISTPVVRSLLESDVSLEEFFSLGMLELSERLGAAHSLHLEKLAREEALHRAEHELAFMAKYNIRGVFIGDDDYPMLLNQLHDAPILLYVLGNADLAPKHALAIVGTRRCSNYGVSFVNKLCGELALYYPDLTIVSGLAMGIDTAGHRGALDNNLTTIAVVAHGLDMVYPAQNRGLLKNIIDAGGAIVTEYPRGVKPFRGNFLERNRIVAGLCPATLVVESEVKGGAMNTANTAFRNNRDVLALPGKVTDILSTGCNQLIQQQKAQIITCTADLVQATGWPPANLPVVPKHRNLFPELDGLADEIFHILQRAGEALSTDQIMAELNVPMHKILSTLTDLEFDGIIARLPGARYELA